MEELGPADRLYNGHAELLANLVQGANVVPRHVRHSCKPFALGRRLDVRKRVEEVLVGDCQALQLRIGQWIGEPGEERSNGRLADRLGQRCEKLRPSAHPRGRHVGRSTDRCCVGGYGIGRCLGWRPISRRLHGRRRFAGRTVGGRHFFRVAVHSILPTLGDAVRGRRAGVACRPRILHHGRIRYDRQCVRAPKLLEDALHRSNARRRRKRSEVGADKARCAFCQISEVKVASQPQPGTQHSEDLLPAALVRHTEPDFVVKTSCTAQGRVERVGPVRGAEYHDRPAVFVLFPGKVVEARQELCDDPALHLALRSLALGCDGVDLVNEQDTWRDTLRLLKRVAERFLRLA